MKRVFTILVLLTTICFAQNFFPYKQGDAVLFQSEYSNSTTNVIISAKKHTFDDTLTVNNKTYVKNFTGEYLFYDDINNILFSLNDSKQEYKILLPALDNSVTIFNCMVERIFTIKYPSTYVFYDDTLNALSLSRVDDYMYGDDYFTIDFCEGFGPVKLYRYQNSLLETESIQILQTKINNIIYPEHIGEIKLREAVPDTVNLDDDSKFYVKYEYDIPDKNLIDSAWVDVSVFNNNGEIKEHVKVPTESLIANAKIDLSNTNPGDYLKLKLYLNADLNPEPVTYPEDGYITVYLTGSAVSTQDIISPKSYKLSQNYPNPFNPSTKISYTLAKPGNVKLTVYNSAGQQVKVLVNEYKNSGTYYEVFNANDLPSGIYFCKLISDRFSKTQKMVLLK